MAEVRSDLHRSSLDDVGGRDTYAAPPHATVFRMPRMPSITGRMSAVTNSFVNAIIPRALPTAEDVDEALTILGMTPDNIRCAYCGDPYTEWDHLRPTVKGRRPTGFIAEIGNLVPACGKCNQSKGNSHWHAWMTGPASLSPTSRGVPDTEMRIRRLAAFEERWPIEPIDVEAAVDAEVWNAYWAKRDELVELAREADELARDIALAVKDARDAVRGQEAGLPPNET